MEIKRNWLLIGALTLTVVGCSGDDDDADKDNTDGSGGVAGSSPGSGGNATATTTKVGPSTVASGGISTAGKGVGGSLVSTGGSGVNTGAAGVPVAPGTGGQSGHAGEPPRGTAGSVSASGGAAVAGARAMAGAAGRVATNGCGRVRYSNLDATGATTDAVQDVLDTLDAGLLVCNQQEFARDDGSEAQFTLRVVIDEDGEATTTIRNRTDASNAFFECILPVYRSADWSELRRLENVSATVRFRTGDC